MAIDREAPLCAASSDPEEPRMASSARGDIGGAGGDSAYIVGVARLSMAYPRAEESDSVFIVSTAFAAETAAEAEGSITSTKTMILPDCTERITSSASGNSL